MHSVNFLALLALLALSTAAQAYQFPSGQLQPGVYAPPALPHNFSTKPQYWRSKSSWRDPPSWIGPRQTARVWNGWSGVKYLFTFGDSYTSTLYDIHGPQPNPGNPLGNPSYPGSTSSNGPNFVDFLTTTYNRSYIETYNLGFGGATIDPLLAPSPYGEIVQSFKQQVEDEFLSTYGDKVAVPWCSADSLFTIFFGINDVILTQAQQNDNLNYDITKSYEALVHQLYYTGARNFVIMNVPPIDRAPGSLQESTSYQKGMADYIGAFNFRLKYLAENLAKKFPDSTVFQLDTNWLFTLTLNYPKYFAETSGFKDTTSYCPVYGRGTSTFNFYDPSCGLPVNEYLWLNDIHPTYPMHNFLAAKIIQLIGG